jgi:tocopherol O-methyltransferase
VPATLSDLRTFYENKTSAILRRYGPGPRVHYHTGLIDNEPAACTDADNLRTLLIESQEHLLYYAARNWQMEQLRGCEFLDVGCGLGGGSLFLAQEFEARVTALTIAPSHAKLVMHFAAQACVSDLITPVISSASEMPGEHQYDAAIAIDSSSSFQRAPWFRRLAHLLRRQRRVFIADCFLRHEKYQQAFDAHWYAQIGTLDEYLDAASAAGFHLDEIEDVSRQAEGFWSLSLALMRLEAVYAPKTSQARTEASRRTHQLVREGLANGGLRHLLLCFS